LLEKFGIGHDEFDTRQVRPAEADAAIDHDPFPLMCWAEAIGAHIHADLSDTAQRHEDEFIPLVLSHGFLFLCPGGRRSISRSPVTLPYVVVSFGRWPLPQNAHRRRLSDVAPH